MTTMAEYHYVKDQDGNALCIKGVSCFRHWLFPALTPLILIILIIVLGTTNMKMSNHLWSVDQRVSNLSNVIQSQHIQDMKMTNQVSNLSDILQSLDTLLQHAQETAKEVQQLQFAVENNKDQLTAVSEALKQLSVVDSLSKSVAGIKCSLNCNNSSATGGCCPLDWTVFGSSCYFFSSESLSWNESSDWCEKQQAHLVILLTDKEWDFVTNQSIPHFYWIGLSDWRTGYWEWVNQTPYTMEHRRWKPGQPDSWTGHGLQGDEDCAHLHGDGRLNDMHCSTALPFICQKDSPNA